MIDTRSVVKLALGLLIVLAGASSCTDDVQPAQSPSTATPSVSQPIPPADQKTASEVFQDLARAIDSASLVKAYTEDDDPNKLLGRPNGYTSKIAFSDSRIAKADTEYTQEDAIERGGSIEVYPDAAGAKQRADYIQLISKNTGLASEYDYLKGPILVRVTGNLPPSKAKIYQTALG